MFVLFSFINPLIIKASFKYGISNTKSSILKARDITSPDTFTGLSKFQPSPQPYVHTYAETKYLGICVLLKLPSYFNVHAPKGQRLCPSKPVAIQQMMTQWTNEPKATGHPVSAFCQHQQLKPPSWSKRGTRRYEDTQLKLFLFLKLQGL